MEHFWNYTKYTELYSILPFRYFSIHDKLSQKLCSEELPSRQQIEREQISFICNLNKGHKCARFKLFPTTKRVTRFNNFVIALRPPFKYRNSVDLSQPVPKMYHSSLTEHIWDYDVKSSPHSALIRAWSRLSVDYPSHAPRAADLGRLGRKLLTQGSDADNDVYHKLDTLCDLYLVDVE